MITYKDVGAAKRRELYVDLDGVMLNDISPVLEGIGFTKFERVGGERLAPLLRTAGEGFLYSARKVSPLFYLAGKNILEEYTFTPEVIELIKDAQREGIKVYGITSNPLRDVKDTERRLKEEAGIELEDIIKVKRSLEKWDMIKNRDSKAVLVNDDTDAFKHFKEEEDKMGFLLRFNHFAIQDFVTLKLKKGLRGGNTCDLHRAVMGFLRE